MAVTIVNVSDFIFSIDGIEYEKNFQSIVSGDNVKILNVYDSKVVLQKNTNYSEYTVGGSSFASAALLQAALVGVLFTSYQQAFDARLDNLEENQVTGVHVYETLASLPVTGTLLVSYKVSNDPTPALNGYYHWNGAVYIKDAELNQEIVDDVAELQANTAGDVAALISQIFGDTYRWRYFINTTTSGGSIPDLQNDDLFISTDSGSVLGIADVKTGDVIGRIASAFVNMGSRFGFKDLETGQDATVEALISQTIGDGYRWRFFVDTSTSAGGVVDLQNGDLFIATEDGTILSVPDVKEGDFVARMDFAWLNLGDRFGFQKLESEMLGLQNFEVVDADAIKQAKIDDISNAVKSIWLDGVLGVGATYSIAVFRNDSLFKTIRIFKQIAAVNTEICKYDVAQTSIATNIETITISEFGGSGYSAKVLIDWSLAQDVLYLALFPNIWKFSERTFSEANFKYDLQNKEDINNALNVKKTENLINGVNELTLTNWTAVSDVIQSQATGWTNYAYFDSNLNEDKFSMSAKIKAVNVGDFQIGIGKRADISGTAVILRKDGTGSFLEFWKMTDQTAPIEDVASRQTLTTALENDAEYLLKVTKNINELSVELIYPDGTIFEHSTSLLVSFSWGYPSIYCILGQCEALEFDFLMPYERNRDPKLFIIGDSFIEGNTLDDQKEFRYANLIADDLGQLETLILGKGGESTTSVLDRFYTQVDWYEDSKYCLIALGANDSNFATYQSNINTMVAYLKSKNITPILTTVTYRSDFPNAAFQASANAFVRGSGEKYLDVSLAVTVPGDETNWRPGFLLDGVHPTITGHGYIHRRAKYDAQYIWK